MMDGILSGTPSNLVNKLDKQISDLYGSHHTLFGIIALITILIGELSTGLV